MITKIIYRLVFFYSVEERESPKIDGGIKSKRGVNHLKESRITLKKAESP